MPLGEYKFDSKLTALLSQSALTLQQLTGAVSQTLKNLVVSLLLPSTLTCEQDPTYSNSSTWGRNST